MGPSSTISPHHQNQALQGCPTCGLQLTALSYFDSAMIAVGVLVSRAGPWPCWLQCLLVAIVGMLVGRDVPLHPTWGISCFGGTLVLAKAAHQLWQGGNDFGEMLVPGEAACLLWRARSCFRGAPAKVGSGALAR